MKSPVGFRHLALFGILSLSPWTLLTAHAVGVGAGGGGDACEKRIDDIREDISFWIEKGGSKGLDLSQEGISLDEYNSRMTEVLAEHAVVVACLKSTAQNPNPVEVAGEPKTCRGYTSPSDHQLHIDCDFDRFMNHTSEADQYSLIHHEFAGLESVEKNVGASSDYAVSKQLTEYLVPVTILRLSIVKPVASSNPVQFSFRDYAIGGARIQSSCDSKARKTQTVVDQMVSANFPALAGHIKVGSWINWADSPDDDCRGLLLKVLTSGGCSDPEESNVCFTVITMDSSDYTLLPESTYSPSSIQFVNDQSQDQDIQDKLKSLQDQGNLVWYEIYKDRNGNPTLSYTQLVPNIP